MKPLTNRYLATLFLSLTARAAVGDPLLDPTRPANAKPMIAPQATSTLRLEAILRSGERHLAIVNGQLVRVGDRIGSAQIDEIFADGIRYTRAGQSQTARLAGQSMAVRRNVARHEDAQ